MYVLYETVDTKKAPDLLQPGVCYLFSEHLLLYFFKDLVCSFPSGGLFESHAFKDGSLRFFHKTREQQFSAVIIVTIKNEVYKKEEPPFR